MEPAAFGQKDAARLKCSSHMAIRRGGRTAQAFGPLLNGDRSRWRGNVRLERHGASLEKDGIT